MNINGTAPIGHIPKGSRAHDPGYGAL